MTKYIVYYRVSTKKQGASGLGLESQKAIIEHFINEDKGGVVIKEFTDVLSGGTRERPELNKALSLCLKEGYTLAVAKIDRLSRKTEDALSIYEELSGRLFSCDVPNLDKFTLTIFMAIAEREKQLVSIRTKAALKAKGARGEKLGNIEFMTDEGRKKGQQRAREVANERENNVKVMESIKMYKDKGLTLQEIADKLNKQKHETPRGGRGKKFHRTTVQRLYKRYLSLQEGV